MKENNVKKNYVYNLMFQITSIITPIITLPYLSRVLEAKGLGEYSFAYSVASYFSLFILLGLNNYGNRTIAASRKDRTALTRNFWGIYILQCCSGGIVAIIYLLYSFSLAPNKTVAFIMFMLLISSAFDINWCLYGLEEFKAAAIRDILTKIIVAICIFVFVNSSDDVWKYALIFSVGMLINKLVLFPIALKEVGIIKVAASEVLKHLKPSLILFIPIVAISLYGTMDKVMIGAMAGDVELGYYHASENIVRVPMALVNSLGAVMLPRMAYLFSLDEKTDEARKAFDNSMLFAIFATSLTAFGIMSVAKEFVPLFYGAGFDTCIYLFYLLLPSCIFLAFANVIRTQYLIPKGKDKQYIISIILGAVTNISINFLFIPRYASVGAAVGTLVAEGVVCIVQSMFVFKEAGIGRNIISSLPFIIAGLVMFLVFRNYSLPYKNVIVALLVKIIICGLFYMMVLGVLIVAQKSLYRNKMK